MVYMRRLVWHIASRLIILFVLVGILACGFFMCLNLANVYVVVTDGMEQRAAVILEKEGTEELSKFFTAEFIASDPALAAVFDGTGIYNYYDITSYSYKLSVEKIWSWPWDDYATMTVVERIPNLVGKVLSGYSAQVSSSTAPAYEGGRYVITLKKSEDGQWLIAGMRQTEKILEAA